MISVAEAKEMIKQSVQPLKAVTVSLLDASDCTLANDVVAEQDVPAYPQSSMDGYAFAFQNVSEQLIIAGESAAGNNNEFSIRQNTAARIFTGAAVPKGADTVVMQEKTSVIDGKLIIEDDTLVAGTNVRSAGSEIKRGERALEKGAYLSPAAIGFLANIGVTNVTVYPKPSVSIIFTGNELKQPGSPLGYGEVYESNSFALRSAFRQFRLPEPELYYVRDDVDELTSTLQKALSISDMVLLTGGVSVGEYDFVTKAAGNCSIDKIFHGIRQRPGKPLYFGMYHDKVVFGLPGNPSSVLTCFYEYVLMAIGCLGGTSLSLAVRHVPVSAGFIKKIKFTQFLKGYYDGDTVSVLSSQESYKMNSFAKANCFVVMGEEVNELKSGDIAEIHLFA